MWTVSGRLLKVRRLGVVGFAEALELQQRLVVSRQQDHIVDELLLLEHPPVITLGVSSKRDNVLASPSVLADRGIEVHETRRGGDVTFHGPGQLVGYPIMSLKPDRCDLHRYVRDLEEVVIRTAASFDVRSTRIPGLTGVWVGTEKLAAIGVRLSRWVTSHGFAFNVTTRLDDFSLIRPCGLRGYGVTSLERLTTTSVSIQAVTDVLTGHFASVFERQPIPEPYQN